MRYLKENYDTEQIRRKESVYLWCILLFSFCYFQPPAVAQSLVFSQYYFSPSNLNPALAGFREEIFVGASYRSQWRDLQVPYNASLFSFNFPLFVEKPKLYHVGGMGFSISQETAGSDQLYHAVRGHFSAAYNLRLDYQSRNVIAMGLQGGFVQNRIDNHQLQWGSQYSELIGYDPSISPSMGDLNHRLTYPAFSAGIAWHHTAQKNYVGDSKYRGMLGLSFINLNRPDISIFSASTHRAPLVYRVHSGIEYGNSHIQLAHQILWVKASSAYHLNFGTYVTYSLSKNNEINANYVKLLLGTWYRLEDAFVLSTGLQTGKFSAALSYDFNQRKMNDNMLSGSAYEISVSYRIPRKTSKKQYGIPLM